MKKDQQINNFDSMLKQSLEGARMPVPTGVWETVGSSIGAKAIVAAKVYAVKLIVVKSVAALVLGGGAIWGAYEILKTDETPQRKDQVVVAPLTEPEATVKNSDPSVKYESPVIKEQSNTVIHRSPVKESAIKTGPVVNPLKPDSTIVNPAKPASEKTVPESKPVEPVFIKESTKIEITKERDNTAKIAEVPYKQEGENTVPLIPDVFTPYDLDGYNDCYKIPIENEIMFSLQIFDSKGYKVFETMDKNNCWDGKNILTGQMSPKGVYIIKLMYQFKNGRKQTASEKLNLK